MRDEKEAVSLFEPLIVSDSSIYKNNLNDLALEVATLSENLKSSLPETIIKPLSILIRSMNCYYSNLIEGHNTHPIDIEKALNDDFSDDLKKRNLQLEAKAHIFVQKWIDEGGMKGSVTNPSNLKEIHRIFCEKLPESLLIMDNLETNKKVKVIPGEFRNCDVQVGKHIAISPGAVPRFMDRFNEVYNTSSQLALILFSAYAHHRFLWVHPFTDGNGRVSRLMSSAILERALEPAGLWSISRGLARNVQEYKQHLALCDIQRQGDTDGRGNLSEKSLAEFAEFFLKTCIDQIKFMKSLIEPKNFNTRIMVWTQEKIKSKELPQKSDLLMKSILHTGELERKDIPDLLGVSDRTARRISSSLQKYGCLSSETSRSPICLAFPAGLADRWMPGLFPPK